MTIIKIPSSKWSETEIQVAETIRDLYRISLFTSVPFTWRCRRKRSIPKHRHRPLNAAAVAAVPVILRRPKATSPATPLSFPATESDDKLQRSKKKISLKKEKEASLKIIQDLTNTQASINQEIQNVKNHYDQLKSSNLKLKLRKQQLLCGTSELNSKLKSPNLEMGKNDRAISLVNNSTKSTAENEEQKKQENQHHQNQDSGPSSGPSFSVRLGHNKGPIDIPDLNLPSEDFIEGVSFQPLDESTRNS